ncbi:nucleolar protein dao-5-like isoform X2 [Sycon ciliatum]|uniref:nucleolar protein dao-5-like isoform X2 n=1 Tax=Sycon ciliatum TaxID=27933 RepID=UPI0031F68A6A
MATDPQQITLKLMGGKPWGFRLQGGKDHGAPLQITKLQRDGKAARQGVCEADYILAINDVVCDKVLHSEALSLLKTSGPTITLKLQRGTAPVRQGESIDAGKARPPQWLARSSSFKRRKLRAARPDNQTDDDEDKDASTEAAAHAAEDDVDGGGQSRQASEIIVNEPVVSEVAATTDEKLTSGEPAAPEAVPQPSTNEASEDAAATSPAKSPAAEQKGEMKVKPDSIELLSSPTKFSRPAAPGRGNRRITAKTVTSSKSDAESNILPAAGGKGASDKAWYKQLFKSINIADEEELSAAHQQSLSVPKSPRKVARSPTFGGSSSPRIVPAIAPKPKMKQRSLTTDSVQDRLQTGEGSAEQLATSPSRGRSNTVCDPTTASSSSGAKPPVAKKPTKPPKPVSPQKPVSLQSHAKGQQTSSSSSQSTPQQQISPTKVFSPSSASPIAVVSPTSPIQQQQQQRMKPTVSPKPSVNIAPKGFSSRPPPARSTPSPNRQDAVYVHHESTEDISREATGSEACTAEAPAADAPQTDTPIEQSHSDQVESQETEPAVVQSSAQPEDTAAEEKSPESVVDTALARVSDAADQNGNTVQQASSSHEAPEPELPQAVEAQAVEAEIEETQTTMDTEDSTKQAPEEEVAAQMTVETNLESAPIAEPDLQEVNEPTETAEDRVDEPCVAAANADSDVQQSASDVVEDTVTFGEAATDETAVTAEVEDIEHPEIDDGQDVAVPDEMEKQTDEGDQSVATASTAEVAAEEVADDQPLAESSGDVGDSAAAEELADDAPHAESSGDVGDSAANDNAPAPGSSFQENTPASEVAALVEEQIIPARVVPSEDIYEDVVHTEPIIADNNDLYDDVLFDDRVDGKVAGNQKEHEVKELQAHHGLAKGLFTYTAHSAREISFQRGDEVTLLRKVDDNWVEGEFNGSTGILPVNYVEILIPIPESTSHPADTPAEQQAKQTAAAATTPAAAEKATTATPTASSNTATTATSTAAAAAAAASTAASNAPRSRSQSIVTKPTRAPPSAPGNTGNTGNGSNPATNEPAAQNNRRDGAGDEATKLVKPCAIARHEFVADHKWELSLRKGELVTLLTRVDENWYEGRLSGKKGIFPVSYVEVLCDVEPSTNGQSEASSTTTNKNTAPTSKDTKGEKYVAMFTYVAQNSDELDLTDGDIVMVEDKCDDGWFVGRSVRSGEFGTFPGNYVKAA